MLVPSERKKMNLNIDIIADSLKKEYDLTRIESKHKERTYEYVIPVKAFKCRISLTGYPVFIYGMGFLHRIFTTLLCRTFS